MHDTASESGGLDGGAEDGEDDDDNGSKTPQSQKSSISQERWSPSPPPVRYHIYLTSPH